MVEHMATGEEEDKNQADGSPDVSVLNQRSNVRPSNAYETDGAEECSSKGNVEHIVDWPLDLGVWSVREMTSDPGTYLFGRLRSNEENVSYARLKTRDSD